MDNFDRSEIATDKEKERGHVRRALKKIGLVFFILVFGLLSFLTGLFLAGREGIFKEMALREAIYVGEVIGKYSQPEPGKLASDINFNLFWQVWDKLAENFVDKEKINEKVMFYGALKGLAGSLGDPYTVFMDPKITLDFEEDLEGTFEGIGAEIGIKNEILTIIAPLPDMPAEKSGLKSGDKIIEINSESSSGMSVDEAVSKIRGPKGTTVNLTIFREGEEKTREFVVERDTIVVKSVRAEEKEGGIFLVEISNFNNDTLTSFNTAITKIKAADSAGLIIDLRNNPGGYLDTAIEIASEWVEEGVVVTEKYSDDKKTEHLARGRARLSGYSTVVLVNEGSASASEILAGALQDYGLAKIVGKQTFGKGSVQTLEDFSDGSSLKVTIAKWLTPKGRSINDEGITPDIAVEFTNEDYDSNRDPQMDKAVAILTGVDISEESDKATTSEELLE